MHYGARLSKLYTINDSSSILVELGLNSFSGGTQPFLNYENRAPSTQIELELDGLRELRLQGRETKGKYVNLGNKMKRLELSLIQSVYILQTE